MGRLRALLVLLLVGLTGLGIRVNAAADPGLKIITWVFGGFLWVAAVTILILSSSFLKETSDGRLVLDKRHWFSRVLGAWFIDLDQRTTSLCMIYWSTVMIASVVSVALCALLLSIFFVVRSVYLYGLINPTSLAVIQVIGLILLGLGIIAAIIYGLIKASGFLKTTPFGAALAKMKQGVCPIIFLSDEEEKNKD